MSKKAQAMVCILLIAKCISLVIQPVLAFDEPWMPKVRGLPGLEPDSPKELVRCWKRVGQVEGCEMEINLFIGIGAPISPACCSAILEITNGCWIRIFPHNPFSLPLQLKRMCGATVAIAPVRHAGSS